MSVVAPGWQVSTQTHGEALAARAEIPGLALLVFGLPPGFTRPEVEGWLEGLARSVEEGSRGVPAEDSLTPILEQALKGLLFSHAEVWAQGDTAPCSVALIHRAGRLGFGWVGDAAVEIQRDGEILDPEWLSVRDPRGREARAWCSPPGHEIRIELASTVHSLTGAAVRVEARWSPESGGGAREPAMPAPAPPAIPDVAAAERGPSAAGPADEGLPSAGVARWLAQHLEWRAETPVPASLEPEPAPIALEEPAGEPAAVEREPEPAQAASRPVPQLSEAAAEIVLPPEVPEWIPPTPEPATPPAGPEPPRPPERIAGHEPRPRTPRRPSWPAPATLAVERPERWKKPALWAALAVALLGLGWLFGALQGSDGPAPTRSSPAVAFLRAIGLAGARFEARIESEPAGAWIAVDGKELAVRTPATLELKPGEHRVDLFFPELGRASHVVQGKKGQRVRLAAPLWGALEVVASDPGAVVAVAVDGEPKGFAPLTLERVAPGPHELRFSGPGMASWGTTVEVRIGEKREVLAYPLQSPATGMLQVRAVHNVGGESQPLAGARVWIDGEPRGVTPLTLELPRGPHSVRVAWRQDEAPVQLIDLPGGNQRFATFEFGLDLETPGLQVKAPGPIALEEPALISATLTPVAAAEVKEMWLHVRTPENRWRRYAMTLLDAQGSAVGAAPFPVALLAPGRKTPYYVSALTVQGDEYFTELLKAEPATRRR
jgi:hypothetical protein